MSGARYRQLVLCGFAAAVVGWVPGLARPESPRQSVPLRELVATLDGRYNSMRSWQADFTQIYSAGLSTRTESGHLYLQKPGRMRWDYTSPQPKMFLVNGHQIWQYTAGDSTATVASVDKTDDLRTPLRFLLGHTDLPKELRELSYSGREVWRPGDQIIEGKPQPGEAGDWGQVWIEITPSYEIDRLLIRAVDGSENDIRLSRIQPNARIPDSLFHFQPPPGVRIVPAQAN